MRTTIYLLLAARLAIPAGAQTSDSSQLNADGQRQSKKSGDAITVRGCVAKQNTDYLLMQPEQGNSYEIQGSKGIRLRQYLGQEVEVTGVEFPSLSTSSDYLARSGPATSITISVRSIRTLETRCTEN
jgi:hypothetical protein